MKQFAPHEVEPGMIYQGSMPYVERGFRSGAYRRLGLNGCGFRSFGLTSPPTSSFITHPFWFIAEWGRTGVASLRPAADWSTMNMRSITAIGSRRLGGSRIVLCDGV